MKPLSGVSEKSNTTVIPECEFCWALARRLYGEGLSEGDFRCVRDLQMAIRTFNGAYHMVGGGELVVRTGP